MASFSDDLTKFILGTGLRADQVLRKMALDGMLGLIKRSPVLTGRYRASHRMSVNAPDLSFEPPGEYEDPTPNVKLPDAKIGDTIYLTNNLPYAQPIEDGYSSKAPKGVYSQTFREMQRNLARAVRAFK